MRPSNLLIFSMTVLFANELFAKKSQPPLAQVQFGPEIVVSNRINEWGLRAAGNFFINRFWSLGLSMAAGAGTSQGSLDNSVMSSLDAEYGSVPGCDCKRAGGDYRFTGAFANIGVHPIESLPMLKLFASLGKVRYSDLTVRVTGRSGGASVEDEAYKEILKESIYNFSTDAAQYGVSYNFSMLGLGLELSGLIQKTLGTQFEVTSTEKYAIPSTVDDIVLEDRPKIALSVSYTFLNSSAGKKKLARNNPDR